MRTSPSKFISSDTSEAIKFTSLIPDIKSLLITIICDWEIPQKCENFSFHLSRPQRILIETFLVYFCFTNNFPFTMFFIVNHLDVFINLNFPELLFMLRATMKRCKVILSHPTSLTIVISSSSLSFVCSLQIKYNRKIEFSLRRGGRAMLKMKNDF